MPFLFDREGLEIFTVEMYREVRLACANGMSERQAAREFNVSRESVRKMMEFSVPLGYRRQKPVRRPKLGKRDADPMPGGKSPCRADIWNSRNCVGPPMGFEPGPKLN